MSQFSSFHFLRPEWLIALFPALLIHWAFWHHQTQEGWRKAIAPHLLSHLLVKDELAYSKLKPVHFLALFWLLSITAVAGPAWQRQPTPFADDQAALVIVLHVSPTMLAKDIQPTRLERSVHKIRDLLALRPGSRTALIAYAGSAHVVLPFTKDHTLIETLAAELSPQLMPKTGDATAEAITQAARLLQNGNLPGSILLITDAITEDQVNTLESGKHFFPTNILAVATRSNVTPPPDSPPAPSLDKRTLELAAGVMGGTLTLVSVDDQDVQTLSRLVERSLVSTSSQESQQWKDAGYYLLVPLCILVLIWFRRGWAIRWR
ncbi:MAG: VWA domain-containing protein [Nitrospirales bacterium]